MTPVSDYRAPVTGRRVVWTAVVAAAAQLCLVAFPATPVAAGQRTGSSRTLTVPELVRAASPAVVFIEHIDARGEAVGFGSGFVVGADGLIVTNFHVIRGASALRVKMLDGEIYDRVQVLDYDQRRDIAVLKLTPFRSLPVLELSDSSSVEIGQDAVAIGNPQGLEHTVSVGVVSAFRQVEGYRLIQISVPISPGSSGGPLFDLRGDVIGITTSGLVGDAQNLNFAVPIEYARPLIASTAAPVSVAEVTARTGGATVPSASAGSLGNGPAGPPPPIEANASLRLDPDDLVAAATVAHDHGAGTFTEACLGILYVTMDRIGYTNQSGMHNWEGPVSSIAEAKKNAFWGSQFGAFHVKLRNEENFNYAVVNEALEFVPADQVLMVIDRVLQHAR